MQIISSTIWYQRFGKKKNHEAFGCNYFILPLISNFRTLTIKVSLIVGKGTRIFLNDYEKKISNNLDGFRRFNSRKHIHPYLQLNFFHDLLLKTSIFVQYSSGHLNYKEFNLFLVCIKRLCKFDFPTLRMN